MKLKLGRFTEIGIHVLLPLLAGAAIYVFIKPFYSWIGKISLPWFHQESLAQKINDGIRYLPLFAAAFIKNNAADFCWAYSMASASIMYNGKVVKIIPVKKMLVVLLGFVTVGEVVQLGLPIFFTFDLWDLGATVAGVWLSYLFLIRLRINKTE